MQNHAEHIVYIEKIVPGGDGIARVGGRVVFIPFAVPGERLRIRLRPGRKDFLRGEILEILEPSPDRQSPPCPLYGSCGGCNLQHMSYERQIEEKQAFVREAFLRTGKMEIPLPPIVGSAPLSYRNRLQVHRTADGTLGFMKRNSNDIIPVLHCPIAHPAADRVFADRPQGKAGRFIVFGTGEWYLSGNVSDSGRDEAGPSAGEEVSASVVLCGKQFEFGVNGFFQSNLLVLEKLLEKFREEVQFSDGPRAQAVDLYAGVGLFGSFLSGFYEKLAVVELNRRSVEYARKNVRNAVFAARNVDSWVDGSGAPHSPDIVVADPPRTGLSQSVTAYLLRELPERFIYVSCDPVTLARDAGRLSAGGMSLQRLVLYDFYPQTSHVESLAVFSRAPG